MNRQSPYPDANPVPYANNTQLHQVPPQRMQQASGMSNPMVRPESFPADRGSYHASPYRSDANSHQRNPSLYHPYPQATRPLHQQQLPDSTTDLRDAVNRDGLESHEQDMEIGYEDNPTPLTFEALEKKFQDETLKLLKEQVDAEDAEIIRHREKILEISNKYQEKLSILRGEQASRREEFLRKESEARVQSRQQGETSYLPVKAGPAGIHGHVAEPKESEARLQSRQQGETSYQPGKAGPVGIHGYVAEPKESEARLQSHWQGETSYLPGNAGPIGIHGYVTEPTGYVARNVGRIDGHGYVSEPTGPGASTAYSADRFHGQIDRPAIRATDNNQRASGRVPTPHGRVYNNSRQ